MQVKELPGNGLKFMANMKLEAIDPLNLSCICVATVMKVGTLFDVVKNQLCRLLQDNIYKLAFITGRGHFRPSHHTRHEAWPCCFWVMLHPGTDKRRTFLLNIPLGATQQLPDDWY